MTTRRINLAVCLALGAAIFAARAAGGEAGSGALAFGVMAAVGLLLWVGPRRDERRARIDLRASAVSGSVVGLACFGAYLHEAANGHDGQPYVVLLALGGVSYLIAIAVLRRSS